MGDGKACTKCKQNSDEQVRDVTKFKFKKVQTSNIFKRFKIRRMFYALCCRMPIRGKNPCPTTDVICTDANSTYHTNYSYWMCNVIFVQWCVTLYWYEHWFYWLQEITLLQSFNWSKPVHYVPTDKIKSSVCIQQILTSFVTSLLTGHRKATSWSVKGKCRKLWEY